MNLIRERKVQRIKHKSVLLKETIEALKIKRDGKYIDATLGLGGHSLEICKRGAMVLGIEWDQEALNIARERLSSCSNVFLSKGNFKNIDVIAEQNGFVPTDGILFDLGVSSLQLEKGLGFSFQRDEELDMRMDPQSQGVTALDLLNILNENELYKLFNQTTQKNVARAVARAVCRARLKRPIRTTGDLVSLVAKKGFVHRRIHPATTIFLALRMAVNSELENLSLALPKAVKILKPGGRLAVISFHSGEDRIVKNFLRSNQQMSKIMILTKKPIRPTKEEIVNNPRARSAKLRVAEKI